MVPEQEPVPVTVTINGRADCRGSTIDARSDAWRVRFVAASIHSQPRASHILRLLQKHTSGNVTISPLEPPSKAGVDAGTAKLLLHSLGPNLLLHHPHQWGVSAPFRMRN